MGGFGVGGDTGPRQATAATTVTMAVAGGDPPPTTTWPCLGHLMQQGHRGPTRLDHICRCFQCTGVAHLLTGHLNRGDEPVPAARHGLNEAW